MDCDDLGVRTERLNADHYLLSSRCRDRPLASAGALRTCGSAIWWWSPVSVSGLVGRCAREIDGHVSFGGLAT